MSVEERIARLEHLEAIRAVEAAYRDHWDSTRAQEWANLFSPDGVFRRADVAGVAGHVQRGREQLAEFCRTLQVGYGRFHMLTTMDVKLDGPDRAHSRIGFLCRMTSTGEYPRASLVTGYYDTRYVLVEGRWLIDTKVERQVFRDDHAYFGVFDDDMPLSGSEGAFDDAR